MENLDRNQNLAYSPVKFSVDYPERLSRGTLLLKTFFGWFYIMIPHGILLLFYQIVAVVVLAIAWWAILLYGIYPRSMFDFIVNYWRWCFRVNAYISFFTDQYPPFNGEESEPYTLKFSIDYPENLSRGTLLLKTFFGWLYVGIPHGIILMFYGMAVGFIQIISFWIVLFTGIYPRSFFDFAIKYWRWGCRVLAYMWLFTDVYPPFNGDE